MPKEGPPYPDDAKKQDATEAPEGNETTSSLEEGGESEPISSEEDAPSEELVVVPENAHALRINEDIDTPREARQEILRQLKARAGRTPDSPPAGEITDAPKESAAAPERAALKEKEAAYLSAYKDLERRRTIINRLLLRRGNIQNEEKKVEALRREYDESRVAYANALTQNVSEKVAERTKTLEERTRAKYEELKQAGALERTESGKEISFDIFMRRASVKNEARAERVAGYLRFREVVRPLAEKKNAARLEALSGRKRNAFNKALVWSGKINAGLDKKYGKTGARVIRAAASAVLISGGAATLGVAGVTAPLGLAALAGIGTYKFARSLGGMMLGAAAGETTGAAFEFFGRKAQKAAKESLRQTNKKAVGTELDINSLRALDTKREKLVKETDEAVFQKRKAVTKALVAMGVGAGSAAVLADFAVIQEAATVAGSTDSLPLSPVSPVESSVPATGSEGLKVVVEETPAVTPQEVPPAATAPSPEAVVEKQSVVNEAPAPEVSAPPAEASPVTSPEISSPSLEEQAKITADLNMQQVLSGGQEIPPMAPDAYDTSISYESYLKGATPSSVTPEGLPVSPEVSEHIPSEGVGESGQLSSSSEQTSSEQLKINPDFDSPVSSEETLPDIQADAMELPPENVSKETAETPSLETVLNESENRSVIGNTAEPEATEDTFKSKEVSSSPETILPNSEEYSTAPEVSESEFFTNIHGTEVTPNTPAVYEVRYPGITESTAVTYGGTFEEQFAFARQYVTLHPGSRVLFDASYTDPLTQIKTPALGGFVSNLQGEISVIPGSLIDAEGKPLPVPTADDLLRKLS